jgi:hypothetical protein
MYEPNSQVSALVEDFERIDREVRGEYQSLTERHEGEFSTLQEQISNRNDHLVEVRRALRADAEKADHSGQVEVGIFKVTCKKDRGFEADLIEILKKQGCYEEAKRIKAIIEIPPPPPEIDYKKMTAFLLSGKLTNELVRYRYEKPLPPAIGGPKAVKLFAEVADK